MTAIHLGIIGTGNAARDLHWPALVQIPEKFTIPMVCNRSLPKAEAFADLVGGAEVVSDYRQLLANQTIEAVLITAPIDLNLELTEAALIAGKHVLVEKPLAANLEQGRKMIRLTGAYPNLVMMVAENFRYRQALITAAQLLESGTIGRPYAAHQIGMAHIDPSSKYVTPWRLTHQYPGGFVTDAGVHDMAALRMLFGEVEVVAAQVASGNPAIGAIDSLSMHFTAPGGLTGTYSRYFSAIGQHEDRLVILGSKGSLSLDNNRLIISVGSQADEVKQFDDNGYLAELEAFHNAVRQGAEVVSSFDEAFKDLELLINAYELAAPGETLTA